MLEKLKDDLRNDTDVQESTEMAILSSKNFELSFRILHSE